MSEKTVPKKRILVCWNKCDEEKLPELLKLFFDNNKEIEFEIVFDENSMDLKLRNQGKEGFHSIIILCELTWQNKNYIDFYGIWLAKRLRLDKINIPILFLSICDREKILKLQLDGEIINTQGLGNFFMQLPVIKDDEKILTHYLERPPLSEIEMIDLCFSYCNPTGIVANIKHDARYCTDISKFKEKILFLISQMGNQYRDIIKEIDKLKNDQIDEFERLCQKIIDTPANDNERALENKMEYKVLILEDEELYGMKELCEEAQKYNISITVCKTPKEACGELILDIYNHYSVVISDYRLKDSNGILLYPQGYRFLQECSMIGIYKFVVFTKLSRDLRLQLAGKMDVEFEVINNKKQVLETEISRSIFLEKIMAWAKESTSLMTSQVTTNPIFHTLYTAFHTQKGFYRKEGNISLQAEKIIKKFDEVYSAKNISDLFKKDNPFVLFWKSKKRVLKMQSEFNIIEKPAMVLRNLVREQIKKDWKPVLRTIEGDDNTQKRKILIRDYIEEPLKENLTILTDTGKKKVAEAIADYILDNKMLSFSLPCEDKERLANLQLYHSEISDNDFKRFENKLIARRAAIYFYDRLRTWQQHSDSNSEINSYPLNQMLYSLLMHGYIEKDDLGSISNDYTRSIWLNLNEINKFLSQGELIGVTIEEKNFFDLILSKTTE